MAKKKLSFEEAMERIEAIVEQLEQEEAPLETVVALYKEGLGLSAYCMEKLTAAGAKRCVKLNVSGPFHSPLLVGAGEKLATELEKVEIHDIAIPYIANVTADYVTDKGQVKSLLEKQVSSSVRWQQTVERMIADGVDTFIEIGPGKTLSGFMRKINRDMKVINIEKVEDLAKLDDLMQ